MCYFCHAQLFEITHVENIESTLVQHSCRNAEVVEAFCRVAALEAIPVDQFTSRPCCTSRARRDAHCTLFGSPNDVASCSRRAYHREWRRHAILIAPAA